MLSQTSRPPNPLAAAPGEPTDMPHRDVKLSDLPSRSGDSTPRENVESVEDRLPKVREGEGEGPEVVYGRDVVLDMAGYHANVGASEEDLLAEHTASESHEAANSRSSVVEAFTQDLVACTLAAPRPSVVPRPSEPILPKASTPLHNGDLSLDVDSLSLDDDEMSTPRRFVRGQSEPPQTPDRPISPTAARHALRPSPRLATTPNGKSFPAAVGMHPSASNVAMDYAWDWGKVPPKEGHLPPTEERVRSESMPPTALDAGLGDVASTGRLKNVEENPYLFVLEMDNGRSHAFELALCGEGMSSDSPNVDALFVDNRATFQS
jgi:phosphatidate phosphatase LPIN